MKHAFDADVFVDVRPVDTLAAADDAKVQALRRACLGKTPRPGERNADHAPVDQMSSDLVTGDPHLLDARIATGRNAHAFANRSKARRLLLPPPPSRHAPDVSGGGALDTAASADVQEHGDSASGSAEPSGPRGRRFSWEQLRRRVLHVEGLACPRCTTAARAVPFDRACAPL